jgi:hypothetical protein
LNFDAIVLPVVVSNGLGNLIEPELLLSLIISPSLKDHVGSTKHFSNSIEWKLRDEVEWSVDVETKFFIQSLCLKFISFVKIENSPFLV